MQCGEEVICVMCLEHVESDILNSESRCGANLFEGVRLTKRRSKSTGVHAQNGTSAKNRCAKSGSGSAEPFALMGSLSCWQT